MASNNLQLVLDLLINLKSNKAQLDQFINNITLVIQKLNPEIKIDTNAVKSQLQGLFKEMDNMTAKGIEFKNALSGIDLNLNANTANAELEQLLTSAVDLETVLNSGVDVHSMVSAFQNASVELDKIIAEAEQAVNVQEKALTELAAAGNAGSAEYIQLEGELTKTKQLLDSLKGAAGTQAKIAPQIDGTKIPKEAKKIGEQAGAELGKGMQQKFAGMNFGEMFKGVLQVFGGTMMAGGLQSLVGSLESVLAAGKEDMEMAESLKLGFKQAGLEGEALEQQLERTGQFATDLANRFAVSTDSVEKYSQQAAFLGGATGKTNENLTTLAVSINKASNGLITGEQVIRAFSRGLGDPEAEANLGRLKMTFPQLATALKDVTEPAEMTQKALAALNPTLQALEEQALGPLGSFEKLQDSLKETKEDLGRSLMEAFAPIAVELGNNLVPIIQSVGSAMATVGKFINENSAVFKTAGIAAGAFAVSLWAVNGGLTNLISGIGNVGKNLIAKFIPSLITQTAATEGAAVAQASLNLAMLANPYVLAIAGIVGLIALMPQLADWLHKSAAEKLEDDKATLELTKSQYELNRKQRELVSGNLDLVEAFKSQGDSAMQNSDLLLKLAQAYPGVIDANKSYTDNLKALEQASAGSRGELGKLENELGDLAKQTIKLNIDIAKDEMAKTKEEIEDTIVDAYKEGGFSEKVGLWIEETLTGTSFERKAAEQAIQKYTDAIYAAKDSKELAKAGTAFQLALFNDKYFANISPELKQKLIKQTTDLVADRQKVLDASNKDISTNAQMLIKSGMDEKDVIEVIARSYNKSAEEARKIVEAQKDSLKKSEEQKTAVEALASAWNDAQEQATNTLNANKSAMAELIKEGKKGTPEYVALLNEGKKAVKDLNEAKKISGQVDQALGIAEKKQGQSALEFAEKKLETIKSQLKFDLESADLARELARLEQGREKNNFDELISIKAKNAELEKEKQAFIDIYKITTGQNGEIQIGLKGLKKDEKDKIANDLKQLNLDLESGHLNELELQAKIKLDAKELEKSLQELERSQLEFDISIGLKEPGDLLELVKKDLKDLQGELEEEQIKLEPFTVAGDLTDEELAKQQDIKKKIIDLKKQILDKEKDIQGQEKAIQDEAIQQIKDSEQQKLDALNKSYDKQLTDYQKFQENWAKTTEKVADKNLKNATDKITKQANAEIENLQKMQDLEIISKESFEKRKSDIEAQADADRQKALEQAEAQKRALEEMAKGFAILNENEKAKAVAEIQKASIEGQIAEILKKPELTPFDEAEIMKLGESLDEVNSVIEEKGSMLNSGMQLLGQSMAEGLSGMMAGESEALVDSFKSFALQMSGAFEKYLSDRISKVILGWFLDLISLSSADPFSKLVLAPVLYALVSGVVHKIADPLLKPLSFASGGLVEQPTLFIAGDGNKLGGDNKEWILRNEQLKQVVLGAVNASNSALEQRLQSIERLLSSLNISTTLKGSDINIALKRTQYQEGLRRL
ncbi:MAG TPA: hypothetical protein PLC04_04145 [Candidatus Kapabacteria bacterium]|nr:hypothetical protein [Candidatus Kapabacteria bacterium]